MKRKRIIENLTIALVVSLIFMYPFTSGFVNTGSDTCFHLNRITSLKAAILHGDLYPMVFLDENYNFGYGLPMFYSSVFIYPFALLKMVFSVATTWRISIFMIIYAACFAIICAFEEFRKDTGIWSRLLVSFLYVTNFYVLSLAYKSGTMAQIIAMAVAPFTLVAIKRVIYDHEDCWVRLGVTFALLLLAHNISFIVYCVLFALLIVFRIKDIFVNKTYLTIIKGTVLAILFCVFYIAPMLEQLQLGIYTVNGYFGNIVETRGLEEFFDLTIADHCGIQENSLPYILYLMPLFSFKNKEQRWVGIVGIAFLLASTRLFPWQLISFLGVFQFSVRLLIVALPYLCLAAGFALEDLLVDRSRFKTVLFSGFMIFSIVVLALGMNVLQGVHGTINKDTTEADIKNCDKMVGYHRTYNMLELSTPEYLPATPFDYYEFQGQMYAYSQDGIYSLSSYTYNSMEHAVKCKPDCQDVVFPKTYYLGYKVDLLDEKGELLMSIPAGLVQDRFVGIHIPDEYINRNLTTRIHYVGTKIQKLSMAVSLLTVAAVIVLNRKKYVKQDKEIH